MRAIVLFYEGEPEVCPVDAVDKGILQQLVVNCRTTFRELAKQSGLSANAVKKRVKKMEDAGVITGYRLSLSPAMAGVNVLYGMLATDGSRDETEFVNLLGKNDKIIAAAAYTGGNYALIAEFRDSQDLWDISTYLRSFEFITNIETHQLMVNRGSTIELSKPHISVLKTLVDNPRKSIVDIAEESGLSARRVRKLVNDFVNSGAVNFGTFLELGAADSIPFLMRIYWDEQATNQQTINSWLKETFTVSLWELYISAEEPIIIGLLTGENLTEVDDISQQTRSYKHILTVTVQISKYHNFFSGIRAQMLQKIIEEAD
jgi:DNA-binding Lrp family transcriptional regulator